MQHKPKPPQEISPNHWIEPPIYAMSGTNVPQHVRDANLEAAKQINAEKEEFIRSCIDTLPTDIVHPEKFRLTLRNDTSPILIIPSHHHPDDKKQKGHLRHTGHTLTFFYDDAWLGTMTIEYNEGRIKIDTTTRNDN